MSALQRNVAQIRPPEPSGRACVVVEALVPSIVIRIWEGETWVLPWSHFNGARLLEGNGDQQLHLFFTHHLVALSGEHLHSLLDDLAALRVANLRNLPADYRPPAESHLPFIWRIEVHSLSESFGGGSVVAP